MSRKFKQASWEDELDDFDDDYYEEEVIEKPIPVAKPMAKTSHKAEETSLHNFLHNLTAKSTGRQLPKKEEIPVEKGFMFQAKPSNFASILTFQENNFCLDLKADNKKKGGFNFDTPSPDDIVKAAQSKAQISPSKKVVIVEEKKKVAETIEKKSTQMKMESKKSYAEKKPEEQRKSEQKKPEEQIADQVEAMQITENSKFTGNKKKKIDLASRKDAKANLNMVVVGHVDAGKSTLLGHLLFLIGQVDEKTMKLYERESHKVGKGSFAFAWVLDATTEERARGVTIDIAVNKLETPHRIITLMDAPGHKDFIPNMISGASRADVALLVIDSVEFETGFEEGGQTKEHALLLRSLGVKQVIVVVNKMEKISWSSARYSEIHERILSYLLTIGFKSTNIRFIPVSGLKGDNLVKKFEGCDWYHGPSLIELFDTFDVPVRDVDKSFRFTVHGVFKGNSSNSVCLHGQVESGICQSSSQVILMPLKRQLTIKNIEIHESAVKLAMAGDYAAITVTGVEMEYVNIGDIVSSVEDCIKMSDTLVAQIITFDLAIPLTLGYSISLFLHGINEEAHLSKLTSLIDKKTGEIIKRNPRMITKNSTAIVEIKCQRSVCVETFKDCNELGRFTIRNSGVSLGAGIILELK